MKLAIRSQVCAPKGKVLLSVDLSQAETWVVAHLANESNMKQELMYGDIHTRAARVIFEDESLTKKDENQRFLGKKTNHSVSYRTTPFMLATSINHESDKPPFVTVTIKQTKVFHEKWHNYFNIKGWWYDIEQKLSSDGTLTTPYRRKREFFERWGDPLFKEATAFVPQSTVADHMYGYIQPEIGIKGGLLGVKKNILDKYSDIKLVNSAHDSGLFEVPEKDVVDIAHLVHKELYRPIMINGETFSIPVDAEYSERWYEDTQEIKI